MKTSRNWMPYLLFLFAGSTFSILSYFLHDKKETFWASISSDFAAAIITVVLLQLLWSMIGGDPLEHLFSGFSTHIDQLLSGLAIHNKTLGDLRETGIQRLFLARHTELPVRREMWNGLVTQVNHIDLMGLTLWREWFEDQRLAQALLDVIKRDGTVRVLLSNPDTSDPATRSRLMTPGEKEHPQLMMGLLASTTAKLKSLLTELEELGDDYKNRLIVRTTPNTLYCSIIRVGPQMFITSYLSHAVGDETPALQVEGVGTRAFNIYEKEFEALFSSGIPWNPPQD